MKIIVIGGTGLIGCRAVAILRRGGHEVIAASPKSGVNSMTGAQVVIDLTNSPAFEDKAVHAPALPRQRDASRADLRDDRGDIRQLGTIGR